MTNEGQTSKKQQVAPFSLLISKEILLLFLLISREAICYTTCCITSLLDLINLATFLSSANLWIISHLAHPCASMNNQGNQMSIGVRFSPLSQNVHNASCQQKSPTSPHLRYSPALFRTVWVLSRYSNFLPHIQVRFICDCKLPKIVNVGMNGCVSLHKMLVW